MKVEVKVLIVIYFLYFCFRMVFSTLYLDFWDLFILSLNKYFIVHSSCDKTISIVEQTSNTRVSNTTDLQLVHNVLMQGPKMYGIYSHTFI